MWKFNMFTNNKLNKNKLNVFRYQKQLRLKGKYSNLKNQNNNNNSQRKLKLTQLRILADWIWNSGCYITIGFIYKNEQPLWLSCQPLVCEVLISRLWITHYLLFLLFKPNIIARVLLKCLWLANNSSYHKAYIIYFTFKWEICGVLNLQHELPWDTTINNRL